MLSSRWGPTLLRLEPQQRRHFFFPSSLLRRLSLVPLRHPRARAHDAARCHARDGYERDCDRDHHDRDRDRRRPETERSAAGFVSRLLFGRRSVLSEGAARGGRRATRARRARRAYIAGGSHRRSSAGTSRAAVALLLVLFSRPVAGRRPRLASSLRSPLRAERGRGARGATGDARATRAARVHRGWFSPPQLSRDIARRGGLSSSSSLVPSPVVVLVSRLLFGRRSVLSEGAARGGRRATRARRARRAYIAGGSHRRSSAGTSRAAVVLSSSSFLPGPRVVPSPAKPDERRPTPVRAVPEGPVAKKKKSATRDRVGLCHGLVRHVVRGAQCQVASFFSLY